MVPASGTRLPPSAKKTCAASHVAIVGAAMLNRTRSQVRWLLENREVSTRPSSAAHTAPADGPNRSDAAILKMSEIEKLIGIAGMRSIAQPLTTVSAARISHSLPSGCRTRCAIDMAITAAPARITVAT